MCNIAKNLSRACASNDADLRKAEKAMSLVLEAMSLEPHKYEGFYDVVQKRPDIGQKVLDILSNAEDQVEVL